MHPFTYTRAATAAEAVRASPPAVAGRASSPAAPRSTI